MILCEEKHSQMVLSECFAMGRMPCEGVAKSVPHLKTKPFKCLAFSCQNMKRLRNRIIRKFLICRDKIVDCKSAHAGSIPASASTFESPVDQGLRGFFMSAIWRSVPQLFGSVPQPDAFSVRDWNAGGCICLEGPLSEP